MRMTDFLSIRTLEFTWRLVLLILLTAVMIRGMAELEHVIHKIERTMISI